MPYFILFELTNVITLPKFIIRSMKQIRLLTLNGVIANRIIDVFKNIVPDHSMMVGHF